MNYLKQQTRALQVAYPGVASYATIRKLIMRLGADGAKRQLEAWSGAGTEAPRRG